MKKDRSMKQRLICAVLVFVMAVTSLIGTTFAWFTDEVTSAGNKIQSGTLKIDLLHKVGDGWTSMKDDPDHKIFDYDKWEPGYTRVETLKIANLGSLALKYRLSISVADGTAILGNNGENLANVIDVYVTYGNAAAASYADVKASWEHKGTLADVMNNPASFIGGELPEANDEQTVNIALHMSEYAGNEYQQLSIGDIYVALIATQLGKESDSFGGDYDNNVNFPITVGKLYSATASVTGDASGNTASNVQIGKAGDTGNATVIAGTKLAEGATSLTLDITAVTDREAVVEMNGGDVAVPLDVHIEGIAPDNTVPVLVEINGVLPSGYASYNIRLYHVENGSTVAMTSVTGLAELDAHNEYYYDTHTGTVTLSMATFSEVTAAVSADNAWDGTTRDITWYNPTSTEFTLNTADEFAGFAAIVGGMAEGIEIDDFSGKTVKLGANINLGGSNGTVFYPVGYHNNKKTYDRTGYSGDSTVTSNVSSFEGTFDGQGYTIANVYQNTWDMFGDYNSGYSGTPNYYKDGMGIFGFVYNGTVKNLVVDGFESDGEFCTTGCVAAYASGSSAFENITVTNCNPRAYNVPNGGVVGYAYAEENATNVISFNNVNVDSSNKISALWGSWDVGCGGILGRVNGATTVNMTDCNVGAIIDVYNDVTANYQYYQYRYSGMLIGTVGGDSDPLSGSEKVSFSNVKVYIGDWADYYYCEFEKNSGASYTDDFQFSRVERNEIVFNEFNMPTSCTHTHTPNEDKMALYLPFNQLYTGYGWGSSPQRTADGVEVIQYFYMITYYDADGSLLNTEYVTDGQSDDTHNVANEKDITYKPTNTDNQFIEWVNKGASAVTSIPKGNRNDIELFATYSGSCYARFYDEKGNLIQTIEIKNKSDVSGLKNVEGPASASEYLEFDHWIIRKTENGKVTSIHIDDFIEDYDFAANNPDIAIYPYYRIADASLGLIGVDVDGDGIFEYFMVQGVAGDNIGKEVTIPGYINDAPVKIIKDFTQGWAQSLEHVIVQEGVEEINDKAFQQTKNLTTLELPTSITYIGANAFALNPGQEGKDKNLTIVYAGTKAQWDEIQKDTNWAKGLILTVVCTDATGTKNKANKDDWTWTSNNT